MIPRLAALLALVGLFAAGPAPAQNGDAQSEDVPSSAFDPARVAALATEAEFAGLILISHGDDILFERAFGEVRSAGGEEHRLDERWRWASITKQVMAVLTMQQIAAGNLELDAPIGRYWPDFPNPLARTVTIRQLMQHVSGLPDPDDTPRLPSGLPVFYSFDAAGTAMEDYCAGPLRAEPGTGYHYNNCDFIILGQILEHVSGEPLDALIAGHIPGTPMLFPAGGETVPGYHFGESEPPIRFAAYGGAGGMNGTLRDLWQFDRALMTGALIDEEARATMWTGDAAIGYAALGQWVLPVSLAGCDEPVRLVERHGGIGGVQARNFILPELDIAVIAFTNRTEAEFAFGQVWRGEGFAHALLSAAACTITSE
jgi:CubicO group peptidase (beta-lactamase class C family)